MVHITKFAAYLQKHPLCAQGLALDSSVATVPGGCASAPCAALEATMAPGESREAPVD